MIALLLTTHPPQLRYVICERPLGHDEKQINFQSNLFHNIVITKRNFIFMSLNQNFKRNMKIQTLRVRSDCRGSDKTVYNCADALFSRQMALVINLWAKSELITRSSVSRWGIQISNAVLKDKPSNFCFKIKLKK